MSDRLETIIEDVDLSDPKYVYHNVNNTRMTPIIITIDAHTTQVDIQKMMEAGMNVVRFKLTENTKGDKIKLLNKIEKATAACCKKYGVQHWPLATCTHLKTCIVKTGILEEEQEFINIKEGTEIILTCDIRFYDKCNANKVFVDNPYLSKDIQIGMEISIQFEEIILHCTEIIDDISIKCKVSKGGRLENFCYVSVRGSKSSKPYLTKNDLQIILFALEFKIDIITINYVRHVSMLKSIRHHIGKGAKKPIIISGICTQFGLNNIDDIIKESDGILLCREFLPYELEVAKRFKLPVIQKWLGAKCKQAGKPFFISGAILHEGLIRGNFLDNEIWDVANTLFDGATGFLLKDAKDTDFIIKAINLINEVCKYIEPLTMNKSQCWRLVNEMKIPVNAAEACILSSVALAHQTNAQVIIVPTVTGHTIKILQWLKPSCIVIAICMNMRVANLLHIYHGVIPLLMNASTRTRNKQFNYIMEERINFAVEYAVKRGLLTYGDNFVTLRRGNETSSYCDSVSVWKVTVSKKALVECTDDDENLDE